MSKIYNNQKGFLILRLTSDDCDKLHFGVQHNTCICNACCSVIKEPIYYVAAINDVLCEECCEDFCNNVSRYTDKNSLLYEIKHFNDITVKLSIPERAIKTIDNKVLIYNNNKILEQLNNTNVI